MSKFITNQKELLSDVANNILPTTKAVKFLVGYFYFSGFEEIYKNIKDKDIKILVGLDAEKGMVSTIREIDTMKVGLQKEVTPKSKLQIRQSYYESIVELASSTDLLEESEEAFKIFIDKISNGSLEIRKTRESNHAKMYLFEKMDSHNEEGEYPGTVITGSSNLSISGLRNRFEINIQTKEADVYNEANEIFNELWQDAVSIVDQDTLDAFEREVIDRIWINKTPSPYLIYLRVLSEYFDAETDRKVDGPEKITNGKYLDLMYQVDAIEDAIKSLEKHNGVIIADVVGLGKSVIASAVAHYLRLRTTIIAPPHLTDQWEDYSDDFHFTSKIYSSGRIEEALKSQSDNHQRLIIVDEAHAYRNEETIDYGNLHKLCQGNKVMLLSATPFNNRPQDVFSLIKLFQIPGRSTIRTVNSLSYRFKELSTKYKKIQKEQREEKDQDADVHVTEINKITEEIRSILDPVVIRRSRIDLEKQNKYAEDLKKQNITFPEVEPPKSLNYELGNLIGPYESTLERISLSEDEDKGFIGARYKPSVYLKNKQAYKERLKEEFNSSDSLKQAQRNVAGFMKRLLVRRFESSIPAFSSTVDSILTSSKKIRDWYDQKGEVPIYKKGKIPNIDRFKTSTGEDVEQTLDEELFEKEIASLQEKGMLLIKKNELKNKFREDLQSDIDLLENIKEEWSQIDIDPKLDALKDMLRDSLAQYPDKKIIIFTEYNDTAEYLNRELSDFFRVFKYSSADANKANKAIIKENFDAGSNTQGNEFDVLVATDAISEGYNLNRAGIVINYDIPYNPTRVIQRVGRINRVNKQVFDTLEIYNCFPSTTGERETRTKQISTLKMFMIHSLLGEDTKFLTSEEVPQSFDQLKESYQEKTKSEIEDSNESWDVEHRNVLYDIQSDDPDLIKESLELPKRVRIGRQATDEKNPGVLLCSKKGGDFAFGFANNLEAADDEISIPVREALNLFAADPEEKSSAVGADFHDIYKRLRENIFRTNTEVSQDRGTQDAIAIVKALMDRDDLKQYEAYFSDLLTVMGDLHNLPDQYKKQIRDMDLDDKNIESEVEDLVASVPPKYLSDVIKSARKIEEGEEEIIVAEQFQNELQ
jgi:superfamily II DNA or RNA helicase